MSRTVLATIVSPRGVEIREMTVPIPPPMPEQAALPDPLADLDALTLDHEFRLILLELGV